jgi:hypothetical protein
MQKSRLNLASSSMLQRVAAAFAMALAWCVVATTTHAAPPTYRVEPVGLDATGLSGYDMNESLTIVGRSLNAQQVGRAFVAVRGEEPALLPTPAEWLSSDAYAISSNGIIVGAVSVQSIASIGSRAAAWYPTKKGYAFTLLTPYPGDTFSTASAVNSHGDIVGGSGGLGLGMYSRSVRFTANGAQLLPQISLPADVNENRVVLAWNQLLDLDDMSLTTIPLPPGNWQGFVGTDLSNNGNFCGYILGFSGCSTFPLRYRPTVGWEFVGGCATTTSAQSINDTGDVSAYVQYGGIWMSFVGETNIEPNLLLASSEIGWAITGLGTVTNGRVILANARLAGSTTTQLVRMIPVIPEDLTGDGAVGADDLALLLAAWGESGGPADLNGDELVNAADLGLLLAAWTG